MNLLDAILDAAQTIFVFSFAVFSLLVGLMASASKRREIDERRDEILADIGDDYETSARYREEIPILERRMVEAFDRTIFGIILFSGVIVAYVVALRVSG